MGVVNYPFVRLMQKIRSWLGSDCCVLEMSGCCYECRSLFPGPGNGHRCRSCSRLFCRKCVHVGSDQPMLCNFCFHAISRDVTIPDSPLSRFCNSRLAHLGELSNFSSPRSVRNDEEEDGDDSEKNFCGSRSELSQYVSDVDSVSISTGLENSLKSANSSPLDSPSRGEDNSPLDHESPSYFRKTGAEYEDPLDSRLSVYRDHEKHKVQRPLDFENNRLIWDPPLPEDEDDDVETGFVGYEDDDEDTSGDSSNFFSSRSFCSRSLSVREKSSDLHKEKLKNSVHGHFKALVCQLLRGEGIQAGSDDGSTVWLDIVSTLAWQAANFVKPDTSKGSSMDPANYVKVKCLLSGKPSDSVLVKGVVCTKNVKHKRMVSQHKTPRLFLLGGALEFERATNKLASINTVLEQEVDHIKTSISKIEAHRPNVLLVEKSVSSYAQEYLLTKDISLVLNVKRALLERIARCSGAKIAPSIDNIAPVRLGHCEMFRVLRFVEECSYGSHLNKKSVKTLMFFEGCPRRLGCTVLLRGSNVEELKKVKHVIQYASFAAYHLSREISFLADEGATLAMAPPAKMFDTDTKITNPSTSKATNLHETQEFGSCSNFEFVEDRSIGSKEHCDEVIGSTVTEERKLETLQEHGATNEGKRTGIDFETEVTDYSTADSQSILVSLSTTCVVKGTVCDPSKLFRIKFYGSFDKPLGRYLRDDLFDQTSYCRSCKEPAETHVRCYTHHHGNLTISVRRHPTMKLPGERDGRIWMWHRCLKCEFDNGVPPAARRVVMSDAAWGLSFGKFLELSFSNHATANRVASCGHSLQKDCLRFYGCGSMVAFFRYSPVDILSVLLPPKVLDFVCRSQQERAKEEAASILSKIEFLHTEVNDVLQGFEQMITTSECEPVKTSIHKYILELKDLLKRETNEYHVVTQPCTTDNGLPFQETIDILELNRLRRSLLIDSHMWDRRLCHLDSFSKSKTSSSKLHPKVSDVESIGNDGSKFRIFPEEDITKPHEENLFRISECNSNNSVEADWSIGNVEGYTPSVPLNFTSESCTASSSLERKQSAASTLSDKIDSLWSGNHETDAIGSITLMDNPLFKNVVSPLRVNSFDSTLRSRDKLHRGGISSSSLHLTSVRSFNALGNFAGMNISKRSPSSKRLNFLPSHSPVFISPSYNLVGEGARMLLPQSGNNDFVIVLYDNEPTTIISYAISSQDHAGFLTSDYHPFSQSQSDEEFDSSKETHFRITFDDETSIPNDKVKFSVMCYFAKQFAALRKKCCPNEADFLRSLSRCKKWNAQGGKSNVYFAKSLDERFIIKEVTKTELDSFEVFAPEYFKYMTDSLNNGSPTCLAKVLGIYQVTVRHLKGGREVKMDLMVMENLFFGRTLSKVYDLKGSLRARYNPDTSGNDNVLLDMNLLESLRTKPIFLGSKAKRSLERAVWNDTSFLASVDVMDYSLLVGIDDERKELVIGIIDFMRQYTWDKHLETWVKASGILGGPKNESPTIVSPLQYKKRFRKAMSKYFLSLPDQWSSS